MSLRKHTKPGIFTEYTPNKGNNGEVNPIVYRAEESMLMERKLNILMLEQDQIQG